MDRRWARTLAIMIVGLLGLGGCASADPDRDATDARSGTLDAVVHASPTCDCCTAHEDYLAGAGFTVTAEVHEQDLAAWKEAHGIPQALWSCHTTVVGGYLVEGHVPAATIAKLLAERPDVDGIALPGMPPGSPGMPGAQTEAWVIEAFVDGEPAGIFDSR